MSSEKGCVELRAKLKMAAAAIVVLAAVIVFFVPVHHGHYIRESKTVEANSELSEVVLDTNKKWLNGVALFSNKPVDMFLRATDDEGKELVEKNIPASLQHAGVWYHVYFPKEVYYTPTCHVLVTSSSATRIKIAPVRARRTFSRRSKIITMLLVLYFLHILMPIKLFLNKFRRMPHSFLLAAMTVLLVFAFYKNGLTSFRAGCEQLVDGALDIAHEGGKIEGGYSLAEYNKETGGIYVYKSQYGLQSRVAMFCLHFVPYKYIKDVLRFLCNVMLSIVLVVLVHFVWLAYGKFMAGCFYFTFMLSPWITSYANNMYWVEFTWFLPMLTGLICSIYGKRRVCRLSCYAAAFVTILVRSLCGYEFITTIMLGSIAFPMADLFEAVFDRNKEDVVFASKKVLFLGLASLAGFVAAICIHAPLRGDGSILAGIKSIIDQDVLRRTYGADLNAFDPVYWESFNASMFDVLDEYIFNWRTDVFFYIHQKMLFPIMMTLSLVIFLIQYERKTLLIKNAAMFAVFFAVSVSWFVLAKGHSYIHTHMNYVLWYFGFVQVCLYVIADFTLKAVHILRQKAVRG